MCERGGGRGVRGRGGEGGGGSVPVGVVFTEEVCLRVPIGRDVIEETRVCVPRPLLARSAAP